MSNSSFSILQESLLANVHRKLNWGLVSAGTGKKMIPSLCSNTGIAVTFLMPPAPKECKRLWAHERLSQFWELSRALPRCRSCPSPWNCQHSPPRSTNEHWWAGEEGRRLDVFVMWTWGPVRALGAAGDRGECWRESFQKSLGNCSVVQFLNCSLDKFLPVWWDGIDQVKHRVWESFLSTAPSHGISYTLCVM